MFISTPAGPSQTKNEQTTLDCQNRRKIDKSESVATRGRPRQRTTRKVQPELNSARSTTAQSDEVHNPISSNNHLLLANGFDAVAVECPTRGRRGVRRKKVIDPSESDSLQKQEKGVNRKGRSHRPAFDAHLPSHSESADNQHVVMNTLAEHEFQLMANTTPSDALMEVSLDGSRCESKIDVPGRHAAQHRLTTSAANQRNRMLDLHPLPPGASAGHKVSHARKRAADVQLIPASQERTDITANTESPVGADNAINGSYDADGNRRLPRSFKGTSSGNYISRQDGIRLPVGQASNQRDDQPLYVNAKQYERIIKRREARAKLELEGRIPQQRKKFMHRSRHEHALKRVRGEGGRFAPGPKQSPSGNRKLDQTCTIKREIQNGKQYNKSQEHHKAHRNHSLKGANVNHHSAIPVQSFQFNSFSNCVPAGIGVPPTQLLNISPAFSVVGSQPQSIQFVQPSTGAEFSSQMFALNQNLPSGIGVPHQQITHVSNAQAIRHPSTQIGYASTQDQTNNNVNSFGKRW